MNNICVGIDFGTTNTIISVYENDKPIIFYDTIFNKIPSKIGYYNNKIYCGNYIPINCENIINNFKLIDDINIKFILDNEYNYLDLYYIFFKHLYYLISNKYNTKYINTVITVPSNFEHNRRENIKNCFKEVGFNILRIINEPTSAAFIYGLYNNYYDNDKILVIDIGGGTTDLTILEKYDSFYEVIHSEGINNLGGNNFTQVIIDDILKLYSNNIINDNNQTDKLYTPTYIFNISQNIKEKLSLLEYYEINDINYSITREKFNILCNDLINKIINILEIINNNYDINEIILVGGTSKIPIIQETIKKIFNKNTKNTSDNSDSIPIKYFSNSEVAVAEGAAYYCYILNKSLHQQDKQSNNNLNSIILADIIPYSIGIELADTSYSIIIPKNTVLPIKISQKYTLDNILLYKNNEQYTTINIKIYQGERKIANKNNLLCEILFDKISVNCIPIIDITIKVDLNFIITITIIDKKSGYEKNTIINNYNNNLYYKNIHNIIINNIDDDELIKNQNIYLIKNYITIIFQNISINNLIQEIEKKYIIDKFKLIEKSIDSMNNLQLLDILNEIKINYTLLIEPIINNNLNYENNLQDNYLNINESKIHNEEINNNKENIIIKINNLLKKYPKHENILNDILDKLKIDNLSNNYIIEQERFLNELETTIFKNYKEELNYLCLFIKNNIINESSDKTNNKNKLNNELINLINSILEKISNTIEIYNWKNELDNFNFTCEQIFIKYN